jgi:hypothetical protein
MSELHSPHDPLGRPLRAALDLFAEALPDVRFPDVSADLLNAKAEAVAARADAVREARDALAEAEAALATEKAGLTDLAGKALAYARVYAEGRPQLKERLDAIALGGAEPAARKRGRPKKRDRDETSASSTPAPGLPFERAEAEEPNGLAAVG